MRINSTFIYVAVSLQEPQSNFPVIVQLGAAFEVAVDGCRITGVETLDVALACWLGCYWIFDIQYPNA